MYDEFGVQIGRTSSCQLRCLCSFLSCMLCQTSRPLSVWLSFVWNMVGFKAKCQAIVTLEMPFGHSINLANVVVTCSKHKPWPPPLPPPLPPLPPQFRALTRPPSPSKAIRWKNKGYGFPNESWSQNSWNRGASGPERSPQFDPQPTV